MDKKVKIITLDWRKYGDYSAVGQLTKKIFSEKNEFAIYSVQCLEKQSLCNMFHCSPDGTIARVFDEEIFHDALQNYIRSLDPNIFYVRLSPHKGVLELAIKLKVAFKHIPMIVHYMDKPSFKEMPAATRIYLTEMYRFLVRRAQSIYVIHEKNRDWIRAEFGRDAKILANFIKEVPNRKYNMLELDSRAIKIAYFGSIDRKMNADSIALFCRVVSNIPWVQFSIYSNSGTISEIDHVCQVSNNITFSDSSLSEASYQASLREADLLLLPYNIDAESCKFLKHSFSNKFVDYLEVGGMILCFGSRQTPTVQSCLESGLAVVFETEDQLRRAFSSKSNLLSHLSTLKLGEQIPRVRNLIASQRQRVLDFYDEIRILAPSTRRYALAEHQQDFLWGEHSIKQLNFLIRRRYYDYYSCSQQSLSVTLMSQLLKRKGYAGFDFEM